ncbi:hypothetical protein MDA_GLEAN10024648 [Myotis davidii]|uniref:Uncharacterized protein n=1 Tax=Myotis davidii TaxID=225400 RepID=L5LXF2_MYODS|nr:hypothetical protein MDA_GLEAN10024648 [Myotis davidii]
MDTEIGGYGVGPRRPLDGLSHGQPGLWRGHSMNRPAVDTEPARRRPVHHLAGQAASWTMPVASPSPVKLKSSHRTSRVAQWVMNSASTYEPENQLRDQPSCLPMNGGTERKRFLKEKGGP